MSKKQIIALLDSLKIPFSGTTISSKEKKYHISPFQQISISGVGPIFYRNKKDQKFYTLLQRRFKDNFQWWFPGGYVELPSAQYGFFLENFDKIKNATSKEFHRNTLLQGNWQKARREINDPKELEKIFKKHKLNWPKEYDINWQSGWQREVLEETAVDINKFPQAKILDLGNSKTLTMGAEANRLINIDGKFCAFLGEFSQEPKYAPDDETEELRWISTEEINFNKKQKKFLAAGFEVSPYAFGVIEEALFALLCEDIKKISTIKNPITKQKISHFNSPQNLQSFLLKKSTNRKIKNLPAIKKFISWKFGEAEVANNLCGKGGNQLYNSTISICKFVSNKN